jgi:hypothetical protein
MTHLPPIAFERVGVWDNLLLAWRKASRGKRGAPTTAAFEHRLADRLLALRDELVEDRYRPGAYTHFYIHEPKRRRISAAPFRDRVVHHALYNLIAPPFERRFIADSYANRVGKGTHRALDKVRHYLRLASRWGWLSAGQYRHAAVMVAELGRLLGGWIRQTAGKRPSADRGAGLKGAPGVARGRVQQ